MAERIPYDRKALIARIAKATCLQDLVSKVPYSGLRNEGAGRDLSKAKTLYDLVLDQKAIQASVYKIDEHVQFLLCRSWSSISELAEELYVDRRNIEFALGRLKSSGYDVMRRFRENAGVTLTEYKINHEKSPC